MKLPSLSLLFSNLINTFKRFPFAILSAIIGVAVIILQNHRNFDYNETHHWQLKLTMCCYIAMLFQVAIVAFSERKYFSVALKFLLQIIGVMAVVGYYYSLPETLSYFSNIRFLMFVIGLHLLIAFIPFSMSAEANGFWQFNKSLFIRFIISALYTTILYTGLSLALLAIDKLFLANINYKLYADLWFVIAGVFNTIFFLAGFPDDFASLEKEIDYPKGLKVFTQYIFLPIITIYLLILYAYMFKIVFTLHWPVGWVSYMVLGFSVAGILSFLLIHPIRNEESNKWMLTFSRFFYFAIYPLLILLFLAIQRRVSDYGITELRYFVLILALWLLFIATYFLVSKQKNIKVIPQSLCFLVFLCSFGPWGAFSVSLRSQKFHFESLMEKNHLMVNGKLIKATKSLPPKDLKQISSITAYINEKHGLSYLQPYFSQNLDSLLKRDSAKRYQQEEKILELLNIKYVGQYDEVESDTKIYYSSYSKYDMVNVNGYDYFVSSYGNRVFGEKVIDSSTYRFEKEFLTVVLNSNTNRLSFKVNADDAYVLNMGEKLTAIENQYGSIIDKLPDSVLTFKGSDAKYDYKLWVSSIDAKKENKATHITSINGKIFIAKRK